MTKDLFQDTFLVEGFNPEEFKNLQSEAKSNAGWEKVYGAYQNDKLLRGRVTGIEQIGKMLCAIVMVEGVKGIIPQEYLGVNNKRHMRTFAGKEIWFKVVNYDREQEIFTGSYIDAQKQRAEITMRHIKEGMGVKFEVTSIRPYGLFGDVGGVRAFIPLEELRYGWIDNLYDEAKVGDVLAVKFINIEEVNESDEDGEDGVTSEHRIQASSKALQRNPWGDGGEAFRFLKNNEYEGEVSGVQEY